jgi:triosephosphate isomerase
MRKPLIVGNWKMYTNHLDSIQMIQKLSYRLDIADYARVDVVVCPPFTALRSAQTVIEVDHLQIQLGAQNCHSEAEGAYTGEISPVMLAKLSVSYVVLGHSERRQVFGENDSDVNRKVKAVHQRAMTPIVCVGETAHEREDGLAEERVGSQVRLSLQGLGTDAVRSLVIAYEPIWAIGTGKTASADDAGQMCRFVRSTVEDQWPSAAENIRVLYGGSVDPGNIAGLMAKRSIDGALVGGASLDPDSFASVVRYWM